MGTGDVFCGICGTGQAPLGAQGGREYGSRSGAAVGFADQATATAGTARDVAGENRAPAPNSAAPPGGPISPGITPGITTGIAADRANETVEQKYLRQTRNATVFIAVVVGIFTTLTVIGTIWAAVHISQVNSQLNGNGIYSNSTCESQGGTDPSC